MLGHESTFAATPDPAEPDLIARIFLSDRSGPVIELSSLYGQISRRHTYRGPMLDQAIPPMVIGALTGTAEIEGAELHWLDGDATRRLRGLLRQADDLDLHDEDRLRERVRWVGGERPDDGVPHSALGPAPTGQAMIRALSAGFGPLGRERADFERQPRIAVLSMELEDDRAWVRAGLALQRVLLTATSSDLAASFLNQALEYADLRAQVRHVIGGRSWPQMVLRIGSPAQAEARTGRRPWRGAVDRFRAEA